MTLGRQHRSLLRPSPHPTTTPSGSVPSSCLCPCPHLLPLPPGPTHLATPLQPYSPGCQDAPRMACACVRPLDRRPPWGLRRCPPHPPAPGEGGPACPAMAPRGLSRSSSTPLTAPVPPAVSSHQTPEKRHHGPRNAPPSSDRTWTDSSASGSSLRCPARGQHACSLAPHPAPRARLSLHVSPGRRSPSSLRSGERTLPPAEDAPPGRGRALSGSGSGARRLHG